MPQYSKTVLVIYCTLPISIYRRIEIKVPQDSKKLLVTYYLLSSLLFLTLDYYKSFPVTASSEVVMGGAGGACAPPIIED